MSSLFDRKKIVPRYKTISYLMLLLGLLIVSKALYTATVKRDYWVKVADRLKRDSVDVKPVRGNILSCDGRLMASSLPEYKLFMDFKALHDSKTDSLWYEKLDSICEGLHDIFPERTKAAFRDSLEKGHKKMSRNWPIWGKRVSYDTYYEVKSLPIFRLRSYSGGFHTEEFNSRQRPFGSLALRTVGDMFGAKDTARCGLELSFDSVLRGKPGIVQRKKVMNKYLSIIERAPIDGADIVTTIDVGIQDLAERALLDELKEINANVGVALVMEVATGDVKAIVNMTKVGDGQYRETQNHAVSDLLEPGSVFKTASIMVALDDGVVDTTYKIETFGGIYDMHGAKMRDHNWHRGGYGTLTLPKTLEYSSNIGVSRIIDEHYGKYPEKFVEGIYRLGLADDLRIPLVGSSPARIRKPKMDKTGKHWANWSKTALAWMSIGYETQVPPISTLTFYNAIANNGKMMRPRFVKQVIKDGEVIMEYPPEVMRQQICKPKTLKEIQTILEHVVSQGLGKKAGSRSFKVAGKTGTAQMSKGAGGYKSGRVDYLLSFAGYFPADAPRYSCIVCIQKTGTPASGGGMSGKVFHHISEGIMAQDLKLRASDARDSLSILIPDVKSGNMLAADYVLNSLGINTANWNGSYANGNPLWGKATKSGNKLQMTKMQESAPDIVPNVEGMGARDAVYLMEGRGIRVKLEGRGKVVSQSIPAGRKIKIGELCILKLH